MNITPEWISGFVDGDGCFSHSGVEEKRFSFLCSENKRSVDVLYALRKHFGCGQVQGGPGEMMQYALRNPAHLQKLCIPHFQKYPLQTKKRDSFQQFATALQEYQTGEKVPEKQWGDTKKQLSAGWFRGFVDVQGCFSVGRVGNTFMPRFFLGAWQDPALMEACRQLIKCGHSWRRKDGMDILQVSAPEELEDRLFPFFETRGSAVLLRTRKRISFQKFRKIVRLMVTGRAATAAGVAQIEKYRSALVSLAPHNKHHLDISGESQAPIPVQEKVPTSWGQEDPEKE